MRAKNSKQKEEEEKSRCDFIYLKKKRASHDHADVIGRDLTANTITSKNVIEDISECFGI